MFDYLINTKFVGHSMPRNVPFLLLILSCANIIFTLFYENVVLPSIIKCWYYFIYKKNKNPSSSNDDKN